MSTNVMGIFQFEDEFIGALRRLKESGFDGLTAMSPIPLHEAEHILGFDKSPVRRFTLAGTLLGAAGGFALSVATALTFILPTSGRPIITTDNVGCRDVVVDGENGFMIKTRDSGDLERAMARFLDTPEDVRSAMGQAARKKAENEFDEKLVLQSYMDAINQETKVS
ncbi:MAG: DUF3341 domain-containing protein [Proteobacteria bacterium]|nr:DUF3341 domain-containing protein [Pseudomonadota bacterium]